MKGTCSCEKKGVSRLNRMEKFICIHGHFYQPPREDSWSGVVEEQPSAQPFHDWNERITKECYAPNARSPILGADQQPEIILNNYAKINFNFGPSLLNWMQEAAGDVYQAILDADRLSQQQFSGHGAAIAQGYNHMILPLANQRDQRTQVIWGIKDFEQRFHRYPEAMWLPETAVDILTLEVLAEFGMKYVILAPVQAQCVRRGFLRKWKNVTKDTLDTRQPYRCHLPSGKKIAVFFYDGGIASDIAFHGLLHNGEDFVQRLLRAFPSASQQARLVHVATDGESYGHHHPFGNMALSYCLWNLEKLNDLRLTVYGEFLERFPPTREVRIHENSAWSCDDHLARWGQRTKASASVAVGEVKNDWRVCFKEALDRLRDELSGIYEEDMQKFFASPWEVRDGYIEVLLNPSNESTRDFFQRQAKIVLSDEHVQRSRLLLEMQRMAMLMFTSCGWFFEDISRIESIQVMKYAARAIEIAKELTGRDLEPVFLSLLELVASVSKNYKNGAEIYKEFIFSRKAQQQIIQSG